MLTALHIKNYILIDSLDIEFPEGLVIISGPTGAGKSILIGALGLLLGVKADASVISQDAQSCAVEGEFVVNDPSVDVLCRENDLDYADGHLTIRRVLSRGGRSRSFINDEPCSQQVLEQLGRHLVDIHSQHDTLLLKDNAYQLSILDAYSGNGPLLEKCVAEYARVRKLTKEQAELQKRIERAESESEFNAAMFKKLDEVGLQEGEIAELEAEQYILAHSEQIKELLNESAELFSPDSIGEREGINSSLSRLCNKLTNLSEFIPELAPVAQRAEQARIELKDISEEISSRNEAVSCSPDRLQWIDDRLSLLYGLLKRFSVEDEKSLIAKREELRKDAFAVDDLRGELETINGQLQAAQEEWDSIAGELSASRKKHSVGFAVEIMADLHFLELDGARFAVALSEGRPGPTGIDAVEFTFSSVPSVPLAPVSRCASGGELSRIMLSLKDVMCRFMHLPTLVFDEIDTGVSGSVADKMGRTVCRMGENMQIFAITHLPQVAAKGEAHYLVEKGADGSTIRKLSDEERIAEVARMLSGDSLTPEAVANAKSLLKNH